MQEPVWVPASLTAVTGCLGYATLCWACGFLPGQASSPPAAAAEAGYSHAVMLALLLHEAWVTLQHGNVLLNPFCQRLDRKYGISMLRKGQHWVIAGVLVMYWAREVASMLLCLPHISVYTQMAVFVSAIYHTVKMFNICLDAHRCWSPTLGIMKLLIDHWHFQTVATQLVSLLRFFLQGYDTMVHVFIVRDLIHYGGLGTGYVWLLHALFVVWLLHAVLNQVSQRSTATLVVESWRYLLGLHKKKACDGAHCHSFAPNGHYCLVCDLLKEDSGKQWKGKSGSFRKAEQKQMLAATFTVQIGALMYAAILFYMDVLRLGLGPQEGLIRNDVLFLHEAWVMLQHGNVLFNPFCQRLDRRYGVSMLRKGQHWVIAGVLVMYWSREVISMLLCLAFTSPRTQLAILISSGYHLVKMHSICCDAQRQWSPTLGIMRLLIDHWHFDTLARRLVSALRFFLQGSDTLTHVMIVRDMLTRSGSPAEAGRLLPLHCLFWVWVVHAALNQATQKSTATLFVEAWRAVLYRQEAPASASVSCGSERSCQVCSLLAEVPKPESAGVDVVFFSHPPYPSSLFSLWWPSAGAPKGAWIPSWWMYLLGPPLSLVIPFLWPILRNGQGFEVAEDVDYAGVHMQNWVMACFGYQYLLWPFRAFVAARIGQSAASAQRRGAKVLCLGALNKAEWMNNGGLGLLRGLGPGVRMVHGNTLTAAAVVEAACGLFGPASSVAAPLFLTGASSKVGAAVALKLLLLGYPVMAHSSDPERLRRLEAKARQRDAWAAARLQVTTSLAQGVYTPHWIIGKQDPRVPRYLPRSSRAVVFSVPNPLEESGRKDVVWVPGGILRLDTARLAKPRQFSNLLADDEIYACHAAGIVTAAHPDWKDELGEVCVDAMAVQWEAAMAMGFSLPPPPTPPTDHSREPRNRLRADVVVIGAGPSGLAAAAALAERSLDVVVLERQTEIRGSWQEHFEGLTITTRAASCGLPGWPVKLASSADELSSDAYVEYLRAYAARFALDVRCGVEVTDIEDQSGEWCISTSRASDGSHQTWIATELVVATGKSVTPQRPKQWSNEPMKSHPSVFHSSEVRGAHMQQAVAAASRGELLVVGFGNSAADLCSSILGQAPGGTVHLSLRRVPPIMRRQWGPLRLEWFARLFSYACDKNGDRLAEWMMQMIEGNIQHLFPADLPRWKARQAKHIPTIDRDGSLVRRLREGSLLPHRDIDALEDAGGGQIRVRFRGEETTRAFSAVVLCTGYRTSIESQHALAGDAVRARAFFIGLGPEPKDLLPLQGIGREAQRTAAQVADILSLKMRQRQAPCKEVCGIVAEASEEQSKDKDI